MTLENSNLELGTRVKAIVHDQTNKNCVFSKILPVRKGSNAAGPRWNVEATTGTIATHSESDNYPVASDDTIDAASLSFGMYHTTIAVSDVALANANAAGNPEAFEQLWLRSLRNRVRTMAKQLENDCFDGSGANSLIGLNTAIDAESEYAGIDGTSVTFWQSTVDTALAPRALTKPLLRNFVFDVADACGEMPTHLVCPFTIGSKLIELYESQVQYVHDGQLGSDRSVVMVEGIPVVMVSNADGYNADGTGWIYAINTNYMHFETIPYMDNHKTLLPGLELPMGMQLVRKPESAHVSEAVLRTRLQLVVEKRSAQGVLKALAL